MSPILIDNRDLLKLGITAVLIIVLAFAGGYLLGYKQATSSYDYKADDSGELSSEMATNITQQDAKEQLRLEQQPSDLNDNIRMESAEIEQKKNIQQAQPSPGQSIEENRSTTIDKFAARDSSAEKKNSTTKINTTEIGATEIGATESTTDEVLQIEASQIETNQVETARTENSGTKINKADTSKAETGFIVNIPANDDVIKFSIQVAVYGRLKNAEQMMKTLQEKKLDAYVSDDRNKKNKLRFNVRFGYFKEKQAAINALKNYIDVHQGGGYLVNYAAEDIVHFSAETPDKKDSSDSEKLNETSNTSELP